MADLNDVIAWLETMPTARDLLAANAPLLDPRGLPGWYRPTVPEPSRAEQDQRGTTPKERQDEHNAYVKALMCEWPYAWADAVLEARDRVDLEARDRVDRGEPAPILKGPTKLVLPDGAP